mgnify:CR=1 FL=1
MHTPSCHMMLEYGEGMASLYSGKHEKESLNYRSGLLRMGQSSSQAEDQT